MDQLKILTPEILEKELSGLVEKNIISIRIADKIKYKIQREKLLITQADLIKLIDHVQFLLKVKTSEVPSHQNAEYSPQNKEVWNHPDPSLIPKQNSSPDCPPQNQISETEKIVNQIKNEQKKYLYPQEGDVKNQENMMVQGSHHETIPLSELINDPEHIIVLFKWLEYLIDKIGNEQLPTLLNYYVDIDWITKNVYMNLLKYAKGLSFDQDQQTKQHQPLAFTITDHLHSYLFIQKLKGTSLNDDFLVKINSELEQMERTLQAHQQPSSGQ